MTHSRDLYEVRHMHDLALALILIFCTPFGWIGMICLALVFAALRG
jgi:hypothetical protein